MRVCFFSAYAHPTLAVKSFFCRINSLPPIEGCAHRSSALALSSFGKLGCDEIACETPPMKSFTINASPRSLAHRYRALSTASVLAIAGSIDVPIIKYSVVWWNSLHQGSTVLKFARPSMDSSMLWPFLVMLPAVTLYVGAVLCIRVQTEILKRERNARWLHDHIRLTEPGSARSREVPAAPDNQGP